MNVCISDWQDVAVDDMYCCAFVHNAISDFVEYVFTYYYLKD
jgi:hypothetical protein